MRFLRRWWKRRLFARLRKKDPLYQALRSSYAAKGTSHHGVMTHYGSFHPNVARCIEPLCELWLFHQGPHGRDVGHGEYAEWVTE